eukprot:TRINITY_DN15867_c0_g1_i2.p1 TRINITY_DN15867_c0_g1~~TRINITY_DN15867_c0_g1_i2.p1  ORF type:complete len:1457 (+),score=115.05 TRINITY_DN15867_c0_g1_i2:467-4372(+)
MARWQPSEISNQLQVRYDCCTVPPGVASCTDHQTPQDEWGNGDAWYLDRHNIQCPGSTLLQRWKLQRPSHTFIYVSFRCCGTLDWSPPPPCPPPPSPPPPSPPPPPTVAPSSSPTKPPTAAPTMVPTFNPTTSPPTASPTRPPSASPSFSPTMVPSEAPTAAPSVSPTTEPSAPPSSGPTPSPTAAPSVSPTAGPSESPTVEPSAAPTAAPTTAVPTAAPTVGPTYSPSMKPSDNPTTAPTSTPTTAPSTTPTANPTGSPSVNPTATPTGTPTTVPTTAPSTAPTASPTGSPSRRPTAMPVTASPTESPSVSPSATPTATPTTVPTMAPSSTPTPRPTGSPSVNPTANPTATPTTAPSVAPSTVPTASPTGSPSRSPTSNPTTTPPTEAPSISPSISPSNAPSTSPTKSPTSVPTSAPTSEPTTTPSGAPTWSPTRDPTVNPTLAPTRPPSPMPSTAPTVSPTQKPTEAPTVSPTTSPSTSPTDGPSVAPTTAPSQSPSAPPTAQPSHSPSTAPSAGPSASPTDGPSWTPSVSPSAGPSQGPSVEPSPQPSHLPSLPPTARPSATPSSAPPSVTPSLPPTAGPSNRTVPPSPAPSTAPSEAPVPGPSAAPFPVPEPAAETVALGASTAGAAVGIAAASAPAAAQAGRLTILTEGCGGVGDLSKSSDHYAWVMHPTGLSIGSFALPNSAGCITANLSILAGFALLHFAISRIAGMVRGVGQLGGQALLRFPSGPLMGAAVLTQGTTLAGSRLVRHASGAGDAFLGLAAILVGYTVPFMSQRGGTKAQDHAVYKRDPHTRSGCGYWWLGSGEWLNMDAQETVERWGITFRAAMPSKHGVLALDLFLTQVAMISAGFGGGSCVACGIMRVFDVLFAACLMTYILFERPYARPIRVPLTLLAQCLLLIASGVLGVGYFVHCRPLEAAAAPFLAAAGGLILVIAAIDVSGTLRAMQIGRHEQLRALMGHFKELDQSGSGELSGDELRRGLQRIWRRDIPEEEFAKLFALVDADGSGQVSLHEFLSSEHLFWDAGTARPVGADSDSDQEMSTLSVSMVATDTLQQELCGMPVTPRAALAADGPPPGSPGRGRRRTVVRRLELGQTSGSTAPRSSLQRRGTRVRLGHFPISPRRAVANASFDSRGLQALPLQAVNADQLSASGEILTPPPTSPSLPGAGRGYWGSNSRSMRLPQTTSSAISPRRLRVTTALARASARRGVTATTPSGLEVSATGISDSEELPLVQTVTGVVGRGSAPAVMPRGGRRMARSMRGSMHAPQPSPRADVPPAEQQGGAWPLAETGSLEQGL